MVTFVLCFNKKLGSFVYIIWLCLHPKRASNDFVSQDRFYLLFRKTKKPSFNQ